MASTMAFRVAQLQGLAHTEAEACSPPSLLYESPSNKFSAADVKAEAGHSKNPPSKTDNALSYNTPSSHCLSPSNPPTNANARAIISSTTDQSAGPGTATSEKTRSSHTSRLSSFTSNVTARRQAAQATSSYTDAEERENVVDACPTSNASDPKKPSKQRFLNIFEDETSEETTSAVHTTSPGRRAPPRLPLREADEGRAAADKEKSSGIQNDTLSHKSAHRNASDDSLQEPARHRRFAYRGPDFTRKMAFEYEAHTRGDAVSVNSPRNGKTSAEYPSRSEDTSYCTRRIQQKFNDAEREQCHVAFTPPHEHWPASGKRGRRPHLASACFPHLLSTHERPAISASASPSASAAVSSTALRFSPVGAAAAPVAAASAGSGGAASPAVGASRYSGEYASEDADDGETEEFIGWRGWRELLEERQLAMEKHMRAQRRNISKREREQRRAAHTEGRGRRHLRASADMQTQASDEHSSPASNTEAEASSEEEDPLGINSKPASTKRSRSLEKLPASTGRTASPQQHLGGAAAAAAARALPAARSNNLPVPAAPPPFFGSSFPTPTYYPTWPPPFYAAAVAAAAAARRAAEEAGVTGQEQRFQDLKNELEAAKRDIKEKEKEASSRLEEERKQYEEKKGELEKQLSQLRDTLEEREKEATVAAAKQAEAEKQKKVLREEFDIITRVHKDMKEEFQREKEVLLTEKTYLQAKVEDMEKDIEFSKDQLLVARESLVAARAKQLTATQAHEQDLKTLQEYRQENETLREDVKYLQIMNLSLSEKVRRLCTTPQPQQQQQQLVHVPAAATGKTAAEAGAPAEAAAATGRGGQRMKKCRAADAREALPQTQEQFQPLEKRGSHNSSSAYRQLPRAMPTLQELLSPQLQQKLLRDRQNGCRNTAACDPLLKEATFTLPSSLESHGESPAACTSAAVGCSATDVHGQGNEERGGASAEDIARSDACMASAAAGGTIPRERGGVDYGEQQSREQRSHQRLSFSFEKKDTSAATLSRILDLSCARLQSGSPAFPSFQKEPAGAAHPPSHAEDRFLRCRSLPLPASGAAATSAASDSAKTSEGRNSTLSQLTTALGEKDEMRLARLCATVLAAQFEREQKRETHTAAVEAKKMHPALAAAASLPSPSNISPRLLPCSPSFPPATLRPSNSPAAAAAQQQRYEQQKQSCRLLPVVPPYTRSTLPSDACQPAADFIFRSVSLACDRRDGQNACSQPFFRGSSSSATQEPRPVSNASLDGEGAAVTSDSFTHHGKPLFSADSNYYTQKLRVTRPPYVSIAEQFLSHPSQDQRLRSDPCCANVSRVCIPSPNLQNQETPPRSVSYISESELPSLHGNRHVFPVSGSSFFAFEGKTDTATSPHFLTHPLSSTSHLSGQQRLPSNGPHAEGGFSTTLAFDNGTGSGDASAAAAGRACTRPCSQQEGDSSSCTSYEVCSNSTAEDALNSCGKPGEKRENEVRRMNGNDCNVMDGGEKKAPWGCKDRDGAHKSHGGAETCAIYKVSRQSKDVFAYKTSKEETACCSSSLSTHTTKSLRNNGTPVVPGLALNRVSRSESCAAENTSRSACNSRGLRGGPNSARTQWLLNRVARISRLQGLQNIQEKLKDLPPALLAASDSARRSSQSRDNHETTKGNNGSSSDSGGNSADGSSNSDNIGGNGNNSNSSST